MDPLLSFLLKQELKPFVFLQQVHEIEKKITHSELVSLMMLSLHKELTMSSLASELGASLSTVTNIGQRLVKRGYIERQRSSRDQRVILVRLTQSGQEIADRVLNQVDDLIGQIRATLSSEELDQFIQLSLRVVQALQEAKKKPVKKSKKTVQKIQIED